jgi:hypothetical protein
MLMCYTLLQVNPNVLTFIHTSDVSSAMTRITGKEFDELISANSEGTRLLKQANGICTMVRCCWLRVNSCTQRLKKIINKSKGQQHISP